jgi:hypothetical protein
MGLIPSRRLRLHGTGTSQFEGCLCFIEQHGAVELYVAPGSRTVCMAALYPSPDNLLWHPILDRGGQAALPGADPGEKLSIDADQLHHAHNHCADVVRGRQAREAD